jgi:lipopolysaccharide assembly protein A
MRILRLLVVLTLALLLAWFSAANWQMVTLKLWPPYVIDVRLPVLLVLAVLAGWLPSALAHSFTRWRLRRRLTRTERELETTRAVATEPAVPAEPATPTVAVPPAL